MDGCVEVGNGISPSGWMLGGMLRGKRVSPFIVKYEEFLLVWSPNEAIFLVGVWTMASDWSVLTNHIGQTPVVFVDIDWIDGICIGPQFWSKLEGMIGERHIQGDKYHRSHLSIVNDLTMIKFWHPFCKNNGCILCFQLQSFNNNVQILFISL